MCEVLCMHACMHAQGHACMGPMFQIDPSLGMAADPISYARTPHSAMAVDLSSEIRPLTRR